MPLILPRYKRISHSINSMITILNKLSASLELFPDEKSCSSHLKASLRICMHIVDSVHLYRVNVTWNIRHVITYRLKDSIPSKYFRSTWRHNCALRSPLKNDRLRSFSLRIQYISIVTKQNTNQAPKNTQRCKLLLPS